jgi:soluble lytic murein transglycosylase-like protein
MIGPGLSPMRVALAAAVTAIAASASASAQVIEVGPEGITTLSGPAVTTSDSVTPILPRGGSPRGATGSLPKEVSFLLEAAGDSSDLSPRLLEAVAYVESRFNQRAISEKGAVGVMQLMPGTASELGVDPADLEGNIRGGGDYLRRMVTLFGNNLELALAAYNAGPSAVIRYGGVPPYAETRAYVDAVMDYLATTSSPETD